MQNNMTETGGMTAPILEEISVQGIVFDLDGVLFDTEPLHREAWNIALNELGIEISPEELMGWTGISCWKLSEDLAGKWKGRYSSEEYYTLKEKHFNSIISSRDSLFTGLFEILEDLSSHLPIAVATTSNRENTELLLEKAGIGRFFRGLVCYEDVERHKPDPEPYLKAAQLIQIEASNCIAIEDSPWGCMSARGAGMFTLGVTTSFSALKIASADRIFTSTLRACTWLKENILTQ